MSTFQQFLDEQMRDPEFAAEFERVVAEEAREPVRARHPVLRRLTALPSNAARGTPLTDKVGGKLVESPPPRLLQGRHGPPP